MERPSVEAPDDCAVRLLTVLPLLALPQLVTQISLFGCGI